jgi:hypothetical protein
MLDELDELRQAIQLGDYNQALALIDELDEMSRDDKINKIASYMRVLLIHLIKQTAEKRTTRSWTASMKIALSQIARSNKRRKSGGYYLDDDDLVMTLAETWPDALELAALEACEGMYTAAQLAAMVSRDELLETALAQIKQRPEA